MINVVLIVFALSIATEISRVVFQEPSIDEQLVTTAEEVNKHCPLIVDSVTQLDNLMALPNHKLQYNYTFYKYNKADIDTVVLKNNMKESLINKLKTDPKLANFKENNVFIGASFYDMTGKYVCNLFVTPGEYGK
ncbi:hypothetical protein FC093_10095 [Ilyomonas limi]|uniref:Uncharacterized protein n=1 Tax=Ilyomonas limi TaxID=2575867 RepID=A0A4V5UUB8_9BACT|nr:hypothetical protein [Ilyomonas limi]TKK68473.1 hypothetical protein FC093_10095 [Ilyomonas limi]